MNANFLCNSALAITGTIILAGCTASVSLRSSETNEAQLISRQTALEPDFS